MFSVEPKGHNIENKKLICSGVNFGFFDKPLIFNVTSELIPEIYPLEFMVSQNKDKESLKIDVIEIPGKGRRIYYYNPPIGTSGLLRPMGLLTLKNKYLLGFMFFVHVLKDRETYCLTYEFYDGLIDNS